MNEQRALFGAMLSLSTEKVLEAKDPSRPYVALEHIPSGGSSLLSTGSAEDSVSTNSVFRRGDVLFGKLRPRLRKCLRAEFDGYCSTDILVLRAKPSVEPRFAGYVAQSDSVFAAAIRTEEGTKMPRCSWSDLQKIEVFSPSRVEQHRIADVLDAVDEAVKHSEALVSKARQVKQGLEHDLLTRGVLPDGTLRPTSELGRTSFGWLPNDWEVKTLCQIANVNRGKFSVRPRNDPRYYGGDTPFIQTGDVALAGGSRLSSYSQTLNKRGVAVSRVFPVGTVMVTIAANIGDTCILARPMCAPDSLVGVEPKSGENSRYLQLCIARRKQWFEARAPQTAQRNINLEDLRPLPIPYPPLPEQERIAAVYEQMETQLNALAAQLNKFRQLRSGLMRDLLTGEVRVPVGDSDV